jgi:4-hydroxybenzoate polyprenyltransferase
VSRVLTGLIRLVHPFPSALDAAVTLALACLAGATGGRAVLLGMAMLAIQFSIGAFNDLFDAPADAIAGRSKPLPDGRVSPRVALAVASAAGPTGLALAALAGPAAALIALTGYAIGLVYDFRLKASPWSWLPYATGIPLLPVFAWVGATERLPTPILALAGLGVLAGTALAIANSLADAERDEASLTATIATALGRTRAIRLGALLDVAAGGGATIAAVVVAGWSAGTWITCAGATTLAAGVALGFRGHLQRAWEVQAVGVGIVAAGWAAAFAAAGLL